MKYIANVASALLLVALSFGAAQAQDSEYKASMEGWEVDMERAIQLSQESGKPIMANFTGTDWCGWCIRLKREVFTTPEFKAWAAENVILLEVDFPKRFRLPEETAQQNAGLAQSFGVRGYPTIWVFNLQTNDETKERTIQALAKTGYVAGGPSSWIGDIQKKMEQAKAAQADQAQGQSGS